MKKIVAAQVEGGVTFAIPLSAQAQGTSKFTFAPSFRTYGVYDDNLFSTAAGECVGSYYLRFTPAGDVPAAVEFGRVAAAPVNTLRQQTHRCQEISVCF